jgi:hypothetical protein
MYVSLSWFRLNIFNKKIHRQCVYFLIVSYQESTFAVNFFLNDAMFDHLLNVIYARFLLCKAYISFYSEYIICGVMIWPNVYSIYWQSWPESIDYIDNYKLVFFFLILSFLPNLLPEMLWNEKYHNNFILHRSIFKNQLKDKLRKYLEKLVYTHTHTHTHTHTRY